jgi:putative FmdB family regulatory protein
MPIYEFICQDCGNEFEKLQAFSDTSTPTCPRCQSVRVQRRLSAPAVHFKGSGWYVTDSKNGAKSAANGKTKEEPSEKSNTEKDNPEKHNTEKSNTEKSSTEKSSPEKSETTKTSGSASPAVKEPA